MKFQMNVYLSCRFPYAYLDKWHPQNVIFIVLLW